MIDWFRPLLNWSEVILGGIALYAFGPVARRIIGAFQLKRLWRERLLRLLPAAQLVAWAVYGVWVIGLIPIDRTTPNVLGLGVVLGVLIIASWFAIRDLISGAILRTEDVYEPGQWLRVDETSGRIRSVGSRSITLEMEDGKHLRVPYRLLSGSVVAKAKQIGTATAHSFSIEIPPDLSVAEAKSQAQRAALFSMWSSAALQPRAEVGAPGDGAVRLDMTVYAVHPDYDLEIEEAVRQWLTRVAGRARKKH